MSLWPEVVNLFTVHRHDLGCLCFECSAASLSLCIMFSKLLLLILNNDSLKSRLIVAEYLPRRKAAR